MVKRPRREYLDHSPGIRQSPTRKRSKSNKGSSFKFLLFYAIIIVMTSSLVIIYINQYVSLSRGNYRLSRLEAERSRLKNQNIHLELEISQLKSLDRIEEIAKSNLGMVEPQSINYIVLDRDEGESSELSKSDLAEEKEVGKIRAKVANFFNILSEVQAGSLE